MSLGVVNSSLVDGTPLEGQTNDSLIKEIQLMKEDIRRENNELRAQISELKGIISEILASQ